VDEYTLSQALGDKLQEVMEEHYKTFIVRTSLPLVALLYTVVVPLTVATCPRRTL
jgi:hypothetical protein